MANKPQSKDGLWLAVILVLLGECCLVVMGAIIRHVSQDVSVIQIVFLRNVLSVLIVFFSLSRMGSVSLSSENHGLLFLRGILGVSAMFCLYFAFSRVALAEVSAIKAMTPLVIPLFALVLLGEHINKLTIVALVLAFVAAIIIVQPITFDASGTALAYSAALASVVFAALVKVIVRKLGASEPSSRIVFYFAVYASIATAPFALFQWQAMPLTHWLALAIMALIATLGQLAITRAFAIQKAGVVGLFGYAAIPFAAVIGWWVWNDAITSDDLFGIAVLICAGAIGVMANDQRGYRKPASFNR